METQSAKETETELHALVKSLQLEVENKTHDAQVMQKSLERLRKEKQISMTYKFGDGRPFYILINLRHSTGLEVIKLFSCSTQLSTKFHLLIKTIKYRQIKKLLALSFSDVVFILLINVKMPTIVGIFNIYEQDKFCPQRS